MAKTLTRSALGSLLLLITDEIIAKFSTLLYLRLAMNKFFSFFSTLLLAIFLNIICLGRAAAISSYTLSQVAEHATPANCWMVIEGNVYDLTSYLSAHDDKLDIRSWCGQDATADYNTKAGKNKDHSSKADDLLKNYIIGTLATATPKATATPTSTVDPTKTASPTEVVQPTKTVTKVETVVATITPTPAVQRPAVKTNPYNVWLPLLVTVILYLVSAKLMPKPSHNFVWDSVLLLGLIPSFVFGIIMALDLDGPNMLYHHVEWSIVFGASCILHLIFRLKVYISQGKFMFRKKIEL